MTKIIHFTKEDLFSNQYHEIEYNGSIGDFVVEKYHGKPIPYSVYSGTPCTENNITFDVDKLVNGYDEYVVMETPSEASTVALIISIISAVVGLVVASRINPKLPPNVNRDQQSSNNAVGSRSNNARPLQRIPDIKGTVKSIPDIIMPPYNRYEGLRDKVEYGYYCIGRKELDIPEDTIKDGDTPISKIRFSDEDFIFQTSATVEVYGPNNSPNNLVGSPPIAVPDVLIGEQINRPLYSPYRSNEVDGIALPPLQETGAVVNINTVPYLGDGETTISCYDVGQPTYFEIGLGKKTLTNPHWLDDNPDFYIGNSLNLINFVVNTYTLTDYQDISGTYKIVNITDEGELLPGTDVYWFTIKLESNGMTFNPGIKEVALNAYVVTEFNTPYNVWYYMTRAEFDRGFVNIVAPNGLFRDTGTGQPLVIDINYQIEVEPLDSNNNPSGTSQILTGTLSGNSEITRGISVDFELPFATRFRCRVKRTTNRFALSGTIVDEIKLDDLYGLVDVDEVEFGNITTMYTKTFLTRFATSSKERQLNCIAIEKVYEYLGNGVFDTNLTTNSSCVQSFITDAIDPKIGGLDIEDIDADGLLDVEQEILTYFNESGHEQFNYTFDSTDITFQDQAQMMFNAINCVVYRDGTQIKAHFEKDDPTPSMLFTHRSKIPNSETYTRNFNPANINDGVEFIWVDPSTNTQETLYIPEDQSALNPKKFELPGFRNYNQALKRVNREYNKIIYQKNAIEFSTTAEGRYIKPGDVISVVKGSRTKTFDGEILDVSVDGYTLTLSQDVEFVAGDTHYVVLKTDDGSTESIAVVPDVSSPPQPSNVITLSGLPSFDIRTGIDYQRRTEFSFGNEAKHAAQLYVVRSIDVSDNNTIKITGVNYDARYYSFDNEDLFAFDSGFSSGFS